MKTSVFNNGLKTAILAICLLSINKGSSQVSASHFSDNVMKPEFEQAEKRRVPVKLGLGLEAYASGNAHGAYYSPNVNLSKGKSMISLGPCLQKRSLEINGLKIGYSYLLSGINDRYDQDEINEMKNDPSDILELRVLCYVQYLHNAKLSYNASRVETITNQESKMNFNQVRLSTIESAICIELDINSKWLKIRTYLGASTFYHTDYINGMYRPKCSPALMFGTGIVIPHL
jgi:hypothetical protein